MKTGSDTINLFGNVPSSLAEEQFDQLLLSDHVRLERIISDGHASPEGFWYDQPEHEWVTILQGSAEILFDGEAAPRPLQVGDSLHIPAHQKHRVVSTSSKEKTIWLALFYC